MNLYNLTAPVLRMASLAVLLFALPIVLDIPVLSLPPVVLLIMLFWSLVALSIAIIIEYS